jgi:hypothetical protein
MENYDSLNNLLSSLSIYETKSNSNSNSNADPHSKHETSTQKLKNDLERDKEKINNTMCFRDLEFKRPEMNAINDINELFNSAKKEEKKETFRDINSELQNRNALFASNRQLHIFENLPKLTRLGDSK